MRIPVTRNFDKQDPIGYLILLDDVEFLQGAMLALGYTIENNSTDIAPARIQVHEVSLVYEPVKKGDEDSGGI